MREGVWGDNFSSVFVFWIWHWIIFGLRGDCKQYLSKLERNLVDVGWNICMEQTCSDVLERSRKWETEPHSDFVLFNTSANRNVLLAVGPNGHTCHQNVPFTFTHITCDDTTVVFLWRGGAGSVRSHHRVHRSTLRLTDSDMFQNILSVFHVKACRPELCRFVFRIVRFLCFLNQ